MGSGVFAKVLNNALLEIVPSKTELISVESKIKDFREKISNRIKKLHIDADVFVGGSFAKRTMIKKRVYDVDVFIRFRVFQDCIDVYPGFMCKRIFSDKGKAVIWYQVCNFRDMM